MDKEAQIKEMANIIRCKAEQLPRCPHTTCSICKATELYTAGYCKASEVASEIFEEIERETKNHGVTYTRRKLSELKKKYTEGKKDNVD